MADSAIAITAGTGTNVDTRTEGTNGNHRQVVVLGDPATNAGVAPVDATAGLKVDGGLAFVIRVEPTVTAGAYTANDCMGGEQTLTDAARSSGGGGILTGITMIAQDDSANLWVANDVKVLIFQANPAGTYTDNAALDSSSLTDADAQDLLLGAFTLDTAVTLGNIVMLKASNVNMPYVCSGSANLFAVAINVGGRTPDATDGITFLYHMIRD